MMTVRCDMDDVGCFIVRDGTVDFFEWPVVYGPFPVCVWFCQA